MADRALMWMGIRKVAGLAMLLGLSALVLTACGSGDETTTTTTTRPVVSPETADQLAKLSDRIASDLDAGNTCHAAHAADDLHAAVEDSDLPASLRPGIDAVAGDLVNQVNCPPPPPPPPEPEPEKKPKKPKPDEHDNGDKHGQRGDHGNGENGGPGDHGGQSDHGGFVPPGQAKLKGEG
jgi:hypothetical protein